jgi:hypothetical protein
MGVFNMSQPISGEPVEVGVPVNILQAEQTGFSVQAKGPEGVAVSAATSDNKISATLGAFTGAAGTGVHGVAGSGSGHPSATPTAGVWGECDTGDGVYGASAGWNGVEGASWSQAHAGVAGQNNAGGPGVWGYSTGNAGQFEGNVIVTGNLAADGAIKGGVASFSTVNVSNDVILSGADCAEHFDVAESEQLEPGSVVVIGEDGALRQSQREYDKRVAGVVSGAGVHRPGIILDRRVSNRDRTLVALVGKVYCKVDATYASVDVGDLLTASPTPGHAMKASDPSRAFGAVIGKALCSIREHRGLIPILIALQ